MHYKTFRDVSIKLNNKKIKDVSIKYMQVVCFFKYVKHNYKREWSGFFQTLATAEMCLNNVFDGGY